jgi:hypothetical protein
MRRADHSSRGVLPSVMCLSVIVKLRKCGGPGPLGGGSVAPKSNKIYGNIVSSFGTF